MSNEVYPSLPGLSFGTQREQSFSTEVQENVNGSEVRQAMRAYPIRRWLLRYEFLRQDAARSLTEFRDLLTFFLRHRGRFDDFLFNDIADNSITGQALGNGNGSNKDFQLVRTIGSFAEPIYSPNAISQVRVNGTPTAAYTVSATGLITFTTAPPNTHPVTADFTYYWRVRFEDDKASFREFVRAFYENERIALKYVPP